jgi:hypothetical protein
MPTSAATKSAWHAEDADVHEGDVATADAAGICVFAIANFSFHGDAALSLTR